MAEEQGDLVHVTTENPVTMYIMPDIAEQSEIKTDVDSGISEVVILSNIAEETVVTTTKSTDLGIHSNQEDKDLTLSVDSTYQISQSEMPPDEVLQEGFQISITPDVVWNEDIKCFSEDGSENEIIKGQTDASLIAINPDINTPYQIDSSEISLRELTKREKDRQRKREQRANPLYRAKEKEKNRKRMKEKRKTDQTYRDIERERDRGRRQIVRHTNEDFRNRERDRDREYRRYQRETEREYQTQLIREDGTNILPDPMLDIRLISYADNT